MPIKTTAVLLAVVSLGLGAWMLRPDPAPTSSLEHPIRRPMITGGDRAAGDHSHDPAHSPAPMRAPQR